MFKRCILAAALVVASTFAHAEDRWLDRQSLVQLVQGNTFKIVDEDGSPTSLVYYSPERMIFAIDLGQGSTHRPMTVGSWAVMGSNLCIDRNGPPLCYAVKAKGPLIQTVATQGRENEIGDGFSAQVFKGDSLGIYHAWQNAERLQLAKDWARAAVITVTGGAIIWQLNQETGGAVISSGPRPHFGPSGGGGGGIVSTPDAPAGGAGHGFGGVECMSGGC